MPTIATLGAASARAFGLFGSTASTAVTDPYFFYNTLLLPGNGTNGAQNNTFLDSSTNNFTITRNGNTTQGTFTPYGANWSVYFNGTSNWLAIPNNTVTQLGTGNFTIEAWLFTQSTAGVIVEQAVFDEGAGNNTGWIFYVSNGGIGFGNAGGGTYISPGLPSGVASVTNRWAHVALVRTSTTNISIYVDGVFYASTSTNVNMNMAQDVRSDTPTLLGVHELQSAGSFFSGYMSNFRMVKGTALYTSNFTPSTTPLTAVSGTGLLTCQSNRFVDNSGNNLSVSSTFSSYSGGSPSVQRFSPFNPSAPYAAGTIGGSGYFDGSGDYLTVPAQTALSFSADFTLEMWVYFTTAPSANYGLFDARASAGTLAAWCWNLYNSSGTKLDFIYGASRLTSASNVPTGQWVHLACTRSGSTIRQFINGVLDANTATTSAAINANLANIYVGNLLDLSTAFPGYISDVRVLKGTAQYTATFTPPTAPLTAITNTQLLLSATNGGIIDNAMMNDLETVGNAQISTTQSKFGGASLYFDGTGDTLNVPANTQSVLLGSGPFTIEFWLYPAASQTSTRTPIISFGNGFTTNVWAIQLNNTSPSYVNRIQFWCYNLNSGAVVAASTGTITATTWTHVALVRNGNVFTIYINGTADGTGTYSGSIDGGSTTLQLQVGFNLPDYFNGYIDDLRITKGYARYTANFTPPTAAFPLS